MLECKYDPKPTDERLETTKYEVLYNIKQWLNDKGLDLFDQTAFNEGYQEACESSSKEQFDGFILDQASYLLRLESFGEEYFKFNGEIFIDAAQDLILKGESFTKSTVFCNGIFSMKEPMKCYSYDSLSEFLGKDGISDLSETIQS